MRLTRIWKSAGMALAVPALAAAVAIGCSDDEEPPGAHMALGDSISQGTGASDPATTGFAPQFRAYVQAAVDSDEPVELINLGVGGETTSSMIADGQLESVVQELRTRNGNDDADDDVAVVTLQIGGNDGATLFEVCAGGLSAECTAAIPSTLQTFAANFDSIVGQLRDAAGPDTIIIAGTYYNALVHPDCPLHASAELGEVVLEGNPTLLPQGLNDLIRATAANHGVRVAEVGALDASQLQPDCKHPSDDGYSAIVDAFTAAYDQP